MFVWKPRKKRIKGGGMRLGEEFKIAIKVKIKY